MIIGKYTDIFVFRVSKGKISLEDYTQGILIETYTSD